MKRRLKQVALGLLLLIAVLCGVLMIPPSWPDGDAPPTPPAGLQRSCTVVRDRFDVPHVSAPSLEAAAYCWGVAWSGKVARPTTCYATTLGASTTGSPRARTSDLFGAPVV